MPPASSSPWRRHWVLSPSATFLNHGSFGACPREVLLFQNRLREELEAQPVDFLVRRAPGLLDEAREFLGRWINGDPEGLAFVPNATTGVNAVVRSFPFQPGDEVLVTDHAYGACRNALAFAAERQGAQVVTATVPFPLTSKQEVIDAVLRCVTKKTRLVLLDHVTSPTGLILPVEGIVNALRGTPADVLVDGAHAPGMVSLDLEALGAAYYTGNAHKWLCAPKGAAFLWVRADRRDQVRPAIISHGAALPTRDRTRFRNEFDWTGTSDPTPWLTIPMAIQFLHNLFPGGWPAIREHNRRLVMAGRAHLLRVLGGTPPCPDDMIGSLVSLPLPDGPSNPPASLYTDPLQDRLWAEHRIEVPIGPWPQPPRRWLRISAQLYNHEAEYAFLADQLQAALSASKMSS